MKLISHDASPTSKFCHLRCFKVLLTSHSVRKTDDILAGTPTHHSETRSQADSTDMECLYGISHHRCHLSNLRIMDIEPQCPHGLQTTSYSQI